MSSWTRAPRNQIGRTLHDVARRDVSDDYDLRDAVKNAMAQQWALDNVRRRTLRGSTAYWFREGIKLAAAALIFIVIGAVLALTLNPGESSHVGGERSPASPPTPALDAPDPEARMIGPMLPEQHDPTVAIFDPAETSTIVALDMVSGRELWRSEAGEPGSSMLTPILGGDTVYGFYKMLYAFDATTGAERWRFEPLGEGFLPAADATSIYVPVDDALVALDARTGQPRWSVPGLAHPAADGNFVFAVGEAGELHALDATTGEERWSVDLITTAAPVIAGDTVYVGAWGAGGEADRVYALDRATGTVRWSFALQGGPYIAAVVDTTVYVFSFDMTGDVIALDAATGEERWRISGEVAPPDSWQFAAGGGLLFLFRYDDAMHVGSSLVALDAMSGEVIWERAAAQGSLVYVDGMLILQPQPEYYDDEAEIAVLDAATGSERWRIATTRSPGLAAADGKLFLVFGAR